MKTYCFGDSFIGIFKLIDTCRVFKFKGATAKGLGKPDSENREKIISVINSLSKSSRDNLCFLFQFGSVDIHHSYFYRLFADPTFNPEDIQGFVFPIVEKYVEFVDSLHCRKKVILAPYYSPIEDEFVYDSLVRYGVVQRKEHDVIPYLAREWRNSIVDTFCQKLAIETRKRNIYMIDLHIAISESGRPRQEFIDQSKYTIHLIWETLILEYVKYLKKCNISLSGIDLSQLSTYIKEKGERLITGKYPDKKV